MRRIDRTCLVTLQSPIRHLMENHVAGSVFTIAPEREAEFDLSLNDFDLIFTNDRVWKLCVTPKTREIFISQGAIELIWCASLAHFLFYTRLIQGKKFDQPGEIDPNSDERVSNALKLLRWAVKCQLDGDTGDNWPPDLPTPEKLPVQESDENVADELCLVTCAFLLHHELAHLRGGHAAFTKQQLEDPNNAALSIAQEKEADIEAADWVLAGIDVESSMFVKRMLGCVNGFLLATAMGFYGWGLGGKAHPFSYDRLTSLLNRPLGNEPHVTKGFAFAVLALHFQNSGRALKKQAFGDPEEALEALCDQLADEVHGRDTETDRD